MLRLRISLAPGGVPGCLLYRTHPPMSGHIYGCVGVSSEVIRAACCVRRVCAHRCAYVPYVINSSSSRANRSDMSGWSASAPSSRSQCAKGASALSRAPVEGGSLPNPCAPRCRREVLRLRMAVVIIVVCTFRVRTVPTVFACACEPPVTDTLLQQ